VKLLFDAPERLASGEGPRDSHPQPPVPRDEEIAPGVPKAHRDGEVPRVRDQEAGGREVVPWGIGENDDPPGQLRHRMSPPDGA